MFTLFWYSFVYILCQLMFSLHKSNGNLTNIQEFNNEQTFHALNACHCRSDHKIKKYPESILTGLFLECSNVSHGNSQYSLTDLIKFARCNLNENIIEYVYTYNTVTYLNSSFLYKLNYCIKIDLTRNKIEQIDNNAFYGLSQLKHLNLSGNHLKQLNASLFMGLISLVKLDLSENSILNIENNTFRSLVNLIYLNLNSNHLFILKKNVFDGLHSLSHLYLASNRIQILEEGVFNGLIKLRKIRLQNNQLKCDCHLSWLLRSENELIKVALNKLVCYSPKNQTRIKLNLVNYEDLLCAKEIYLQEFILKPNKTRKFEIGQTLNLSCTVIDAKPLNSIHFYKDDNLINSTNIIKQGLITYNNYTMNFIEHQLIITHLNYDNSGTYKCMVLSSYGNSTKSFILEITNSANSLNNLVKSINFKSVSIVFSSCLLSISILIYIINFKKIEMNYRLKINQIHLWIQILILINQIHFAKRNNFSTKLKCDFYGLFIYFVLVYILINFLLTTVYFYKQLIKGAHDYIVDKSNDNRKQTDLSNRLPINSFNSSYFHLYNFQSNSCLRLTKFIFRHYTIRYNLLNLSFTFLITLIFGLFNLPQFSTKLYCFTNVILISNFYILIPLIVLIVMQVCLFILIKFALLRFYSLHKKLEQRPTDFCISLKSQLDTTHSFHVNKCLPCFRASLALDFCWSISKHYFVQIITFFFFIITIFTLVFKIYIQYQDVQWPPIWLFWIYLKNIFHTSNTNVRSLMNSESLVANFAKLNQSLIENQVLHLNSNFSSSLVDHKELNKHDDHLDGLIYKQKIEHLTTDQILQFIYLVLVLVLSTYIFLQFCFLRKDVRNLMKMFFKKIFCFKNLKQNYPNNLRNQRNIKVFDNYTKALKSQTLSHNLNSQTNYYDNHSNLANNNHMKILNNQDLMVESFDQSDKFNVNSQITSLEDDFDLMHIRNKNIFYKQLDYQNKSKVQFLQDNVKLIELPSSDSSNTTVTNCGPTININETDLFGKQFKSSNQHFLDTSKYYFGPEKEYVHYETVNLDNCSKKYNVPLKTNNSQNLQLENFIEKRKISKNKNHLKNSFDNINLDPNYRNNSLEQTKAKSDIVLIRNKNKHVVQYKNSNVPNTFVENYYQKQAMKKKLENKIQNSNQHFILQSTNNLNYDKDLQPQFSSRSLIQTNHKYKNTLSSNQSVLTTKIEREFADQLKKNRSNLFDELEYIPPISRNFSCKSDIMSTVSQPLTFVSTKSQPAYNEKRVLMKHIKQNKNAESFYFNYNMPFSSKKSLQNNSQDFALNQNKNYQLNTKKIKFTNRKSNSSFQQFLDLNASKPLLICGPTVTIPNEDKCSEKANFRYLNNSNKKETKTSENLYESIGPKLDLANNKYESTNVKNLEKSYGKVLNGEHEDLFYDNLDLCSNNGNEEIKFKNHHHNKSKNSTITKQYNNFHQANVTHQLNGSLDKIYNDKVYVNSLTPQLAKKSKRKIKYDLTSESNS